MSKREFLKIGVIALVFVVLALTVSGVLAATEGEVTGEIKEVGEDYLLVVTEDETEVTVYLPEGETNEGYEVGTTILAEGVWLEEGFQATSIKEVLESEEPEEGEGEEGEEPEEGEEGEEGEPFQNAFCTGEKGEGVMHPLAEKIAARYGEATGVTAEQVQDYFCQGYSIGEIMLALMTHMFNGEEVEAILDKRDTGMGWGNIWKDAGMIGNAKEGTPPGLVKKPDKTPPGQDKKEDWTPPGQLNKEDKTPPGQLNKPEKNKNKNKDGGFLTTQATWF